MLTTGDPLGMADFKRNSVLFHARNRENRTPFVLFIGHDEVITSCKLSWLSLSTVGELALLTGRPRSATVLAVTDAQLVRLSQTQFDRLAARHPQEMLQFAQSMLPRLQRAQLVEPLRRLFGELDRLMLQRLETLLEWRHLRNGERLFTQGDPGDSLYVVINGRLRLVERSTAGDEQMIREVGRGESVGEAALITGGARTFGAYAVRDTYVVRQASQHFAQWVQKYPGAMTQLAREVVRRLELPREPGNPAHNVRTVAIVPANALVPLVAFTAVLATFLGEWDATLPLSSARVDELVGKAGVAQTDVDHPTEISLLYWLNQQESRYRYVLYQADATWSSWTRRYLEQADRILIVGRAGDNSTPGPIERELSGMAATGRHGLVLLHPPTTRRPLGTARWLAPRHVFTHHHVRLDHQDDLKRLGRRLTGRAVGLVLGGGGARGMAHIGVIRALEEAGSAVDLVGGSSMGALIAACYAKGLSVDELAGQVAKLANSRRLLDFTWPLASVFAGRRVTALVHPCSTVFWRRRATSRTPYRSCVAMGRCGGALGPASCCR